jgi:hypothetical protein
MYSSSFRRSMRHPSSPDLDRREIPGLDESADQALFRRELVSDLSD